MHKAFRIIAAAALAVVLTGNASAQAEKDDWKNLIQGDSLKGWEQKNGKAKYTVKDGVITGSSVPNTPNSFLCTTEKYGDFILEFEFMGHDELNSGVQIRSESLANVKNYRVHGYQLELEEDRRDRDWSGGIYDEARRGWIYPMNGDEAHGKLFGDQGKRLWKEGEWNQFRVECKGDKIKTWLNGELRTDLTDDKTLSGFIALQVHGVGNRTNPMSVKWRKIRIKKI
jgi:hypothetical protein